MNREELIEALVKFTEQTGVEWESLWDWIASDEFAVVFKIEEETEDE